MENQKPKPRPVKVRKYDYDAAFNEIWEMYPKRLGNNPKNAAYRAYNARLAEKVAVEDIRAGVERYKAFCDVTHKTGTEFVLQASTFLGPRYEFEEEWTLPTIENIQPRTNDEWFKLGKAKGIEAKIGETWDDLVKRIQGAMR